MNKVIIVNYIYLLQEREFTKTNENIFKVGMTTKENYGRFNQYPNGSILLFQMICNDCSFYEKKIIKIFKNKFIHRKEIGNEYFECKDYNDMIDIIYSTIKNGNNDNDNTNSDNTNSDNTTNNSDNTTNNSDNTDNKKNKCKNTFIYKMLLPPEKKQKCTPSYICEQCNYITEIKSNYKKHLLSSIHKKIAKISLNNPYYCKYCDYSTKRKNDYHKHMITKKHIEKENNYTNLIPINNKKTYKQKN